MKRPTTKQWASFIGGFLMVAPGTYVLRVYGWRLWLAFLAYVIALRIAGYIEGLETGAQR